MEFPHDLFEPLFLYMLVGVFNPAPINLPHPGGGS